MKIKPTTTIQELIDELKADQSESDPDAICIYSAEDGDEIPEGICIVITDNLMIKSKLEEIYDRY